MPGADDDEIRPFFSCHPGDGLYGVRLQGVRLDPRRGFRRQRAELGEERLNRLLAKGGDDVHGATRRAGQLRRLSYCASPGAGG